MNLLIAPLLGIAGGLVVAVAQFFFLRRTNWEAKLSERTTAAYSDYLSAVARIANPHPMGDYDVMDKAIHQLADAKCRIAVYGDKDVLRAIALFTRLGNVIDTVEQKTAFVNVVQAMRQDNGAKLRAIDKDIAALLFDEMN